MVVHLLLEHQRQPVRRERLFAKRSEPPLGRRASGVVLDERAHRRELFRVDAAAGGAALVLPVDVVFELVVASEFLQNDARICRGSPITSRIFAGTVAF